MRSNLLYQNNTGGVYSRCSLGRLVLRCPGSGRAPSGADVSYPDSGSRLRDPGCPGQPSAAGRRLKVYVLRGCFVFGVSCTSILRSLLHLLVSSPLLCLLNSSPYCTSSFPFLAAPPPLLSLLFLLLSSPYYCSSSCLLTPPPPPPLLSILYSLISVNSVFLGM